MQIELMQSYVADDVVQHLNISRIFVGTPSIFESLRLEQIYLYCKTIITPLLGLFLGLQFDVELKLL